MRPDARIRLSYAGSLTTASTAAATIFCCLPFATGILGVGVVAFGAQFAPFQPYLTSASVAFLAYGFYEAYRPSAAACADDTCNVPSGLRYRRMALWVVAVIVAALLTARWWVSSVIYWTL
jgi:hypothetical protein